MTTGGTRALHLGQLDDMIARAEAACERYRLAASERRLSPPTSRRLGAWLMMRASLARLRALRGEQHS